MADEHGEKTEQPTSKRLEEASRRGQFARSPEINTALAVLAAALGLHAFGKSLSGGLLAALSEGLGNLHQGMPSEVVVGRLLGNWLWLLATLTAGIAGAACLASVVASVLQSRFRFSPGSLGWHWERLDPLSGLQRLVQPAALVRSGVSLLKLVVILAVTGSLIVRLSEDPIFQSGSSLEDLLVFMSRSVESLLWRILGGIGVIIAVDYSYQLWNTQQALKMTKEEVREEARSGEGDPKAKAEQRRRRLQTRKNWRASVPTADVVVTNPTHLAIALKYDFNKAGAAPVVVAKGADHNAARIREIAREFQVPIIENKPVARLLYETCDEDQAIDPRLYQAVAEILALVYRTNRYRYYIQGLRIPYGR